VQHWADRTLGVNCFVAAKTDGRATVAGGAPGYEMDVIASAGGRGPNALSEPTPYRFYLSKRESGWQVDTWQNRVNGTTEAVTLRALGANAPTPCIPKEK
jgi:hypothetical protein